MGETTGEGRRPPPFPDPEAFAEQLEPFWDKLYRTATALCGPTDGDDVLQDALAAAWRKRSQFDPSRGSFRGWLVAILVDQAHKHRSRRWVYVARLVYTEVSPAVPDVDTALAVDLARAVRALPGRQRLAIALYYYADLSIEDVAGVMGCSAGTVKSSLADARLSLRTAIGGINVDE